MYSYWSIIKLLSHMANACIQYHLMPPCLITYYLNLSITELNTVNKYKTLLILSHHSDTLNKCTIHMQVYTVCSYVMPMLNTDYEFYTLQDKTFGRESLVVDTESLPRELQFGLQFHWDSHRWDWMHLPFMPCIPIHLSRF